MEALDAIEKVALPEGYAGPWIVERFTVPTVRKGKAPFWRELPVGTYTRLRHRERGIVMSDIPHEMLDHLEPVSRARGHCLINGLGLGMVLAAVLKKPDVTDVTVVEVDQDVIDLVAPAYAGDPRLTIVNADAFTYQPPQGQRYGMVWHDIWDGIGTANLEQMAMLRRKFDQIADWQGCWAEDLCVRWAAREAATPDPYQAWARDPGSVAALSHGFGATRRPLTKRNLGLLQIAETPAIFPSDKAPYRK